MPRTLLLWLLAGLLIPPAPGAAAQSSTERTNYDAPESGAQMATSLADRIEAVRATYGLQPVPVVAALTEVARAHVRDLVDNHPDQGGCGLHSWSGRGRWTAVCWNATPNGPAMWRKPSEITWGRFNGYGFEIAVGDAAALITPEQAIGTWMASRLHRDVILQQGSWKGRTWRAMGVAVCRGYAVAWFSDATG